MIDSDLVLTVGDIHFSDRPPSSCTDTYLADLFDLMRHTVKLAKDLNVAAVVWAGDVFHHKAPSRTSHATMQRVIDIGQSYHCPWLIVPGNHDIPFDRQDAVMDTQPLGVLFKAGAILLKGWSQRCGGPPLPIYGVPWLQEFGRHHYDETVCDVAVSSALADYRNLESPREFNSLVVTHAPMYPPGIELPYEFYPTSKWAEAMNGHGCVYYGHVHESHGIFEVGGVRFCNHGAISRGSLHEHNLTREVSVTSWGMKTGKFTKHVLPHKPASEVFRFKEANEVKDATARLDEFLAQVSKANIEITSIEAVLAQVKANDPPLPPAVVAKAEELLTAAQAGEL